MHTVVITFELVDMTPEQYRDVCSELAPAFAAVPGLLTKIWLTTPADGRRGGIYLFGDAAAGDDFLGSALARGVATNPHFGDLTVRRFEVDEETTARTQPVLTVVGAPAQV
ncbi:hypothetical protein GCM10009836_32490 [Pseudonocardia ailaonensis]|uniref:Monooxygenase n=1 Tax=Pseudonocardia ailaonensis TaxID=367279 RepID=A0ABN2N430_9PSEU